MRSRILAFFAFLWVAFTIIDIVVWVSQLTPFVAWIILLEFALALIFGKLAHDAHHKNEKLK